MLARAFVALQYLLPQHLLSRGMLWLTRRRQRWLRVPLTRLFLRGFRPDLSDALQPDAMAYPDFNSFFTRALRADARPMPDTADAIASPVDGTVSQAGCIEAGLLLQAKGRQYSLEALLAGRERWIECFRDGQFATIYLAPYNYHRIHMPLTGTLTEAWHVPGRLFSVNAVTAAQVPELFARNERLICGFDGARGPFAVVLVGALFVGSMSTVWHGNVTPRRRHAVTTLDPAPDAAPLQRARGEELGRFNMGSTVILLLPPRSGRWDTSLAPGRVLRVGQAIGHWPATGTATS